MPKGRRLRWARFRMNAWYWLRSRWDRYLLFPLWRDEEAPDPPWYVARPSGFFGGRYHKAMVEIGRIVRNHDPCDWEYL